MAKILGDIGQVLARILEPERGSVSIDELRDREGVSLVYDVGGIAEADLYSQDTRGFDTGALAQSTNNTQTITGLPPIFQVLGVFLTTNQPTRLNYVVVNAHAVGVAGSLRDFPLWIWLTGDQTINQPATVIGDSALGAMMVPPEDQQFFKVGVPLAFQPAIKSRQGVESITIRTATTAFGAGTVQVTGHIVIGFFRRGRFLVAARPF